MKGLELSERYFFEICLPMLTEKFPDYQHKIAAGLVGDGSECFGFDDEISRDHDWGAGVCLWLTKQDYELIGAELQAELKKLPKEFMGLPAKAVSDWGYGRTGVFEIGQFYKRFIGFDHVPANLLEWRVIPEINLAAATNGKVFIDPYGKFTSFRNKLKEFYPEDIRLKKIAARCMKMAQSGQYNYLRCVKRGEFVAAKLAEAEFMETAISMVFLLNKKYMPYYKWMHRALKDLPILGDTVYQLFSDLVTTHEVAAGELVYGRKSKLIEEVCWHVINELRRQGLSNSTSSFLLDHGPEVQSRIQDNLIKGINVWAE